jgi:hypothetical protein
VRNNEEDSEEIAMEHISKKVEKRLQFSKTGQPLLHHDSKHSEEDELVNWKKNFHFASFPLYDFGNWIPFVMARWPCLGTGCGLPQVAFKNSKGNFLFACTINRSILCSIVYTTIV